jgi:choline kinase
MTPAIILAAGQGSRMRSLTDDRPKCLVELAGRPLLHWQLDALRAAGIDEIHVVSGYMGHRLRGPFQKIANPRWERTNMVASLACAHDLLSSRNCLAAYSDIVYHPDHVKRLAQADGDIAVTYDTRWEELWRLRFADPLSDAETFITDNGALREIGARPQSIDQVQGQYMGLMKFTPRGWSLVRDALAALPPASLDALDITALLGLLLEQGASVSAVPVDGRWAEVDSGDDLAAYERAIADNQNVFSHDWRFSGQW